MKHAIKPYRQGDLDALCGVYAIINACRLLGPELDDSTWVTLFERLVRLAARRKKRREPRGTCDLLSSGLLHTDLLVLLRCALRIVSGWTGVRLNARQLRCRPGPHSTVWRDLGAELNGSTVAIAGLAGGEAHWTVIIRARVAWLDLFDSAGRTQLPRKACAHANDGQGIFLDPDEIVLVTRSARAARRSAIPSRSWEDPNVNAGRPSRGGLRPARVVAVNVAGRVARKPKHNKRRQAVLDAIVAALMARPHWSPVDAVLLPGGFFWDDRELGPLPSSERRERLLDAKYGQAALRAARTLASTFPTVTLVLGVDVAGSVRKAPPEHLITAVNEAGIAGLAMKAFPSPEDAEMGLIAHASDFSSNDRFIKLANGSATVLGACYDGFGLALAHGSRAGIVRFVTRLGMGDRLVVASPAARELLASKFLVELERHNPTVALLAVHKIRAARSDGYWQRHGIAMASAALGGALVVGATHYEQLTIDAPHLASRHVPSGHLEAGFNRKAHRLTPLDQVAIEQSGKLIAVAALLSG